MATAGLSSGAPADAPVGGAEGAARVRGQGDRVVGVLGGPLAGRPPGAGLDELVAVVDWPELPVPAEAGSVADIACATEFTCESFFDTGGPV